MSVGTTSRNHNIYQTGADLYIELKGRVVLEEVDGLKKSILPRITGNLANVYVDLQNVENLDSAGLGLLINLKMSSKMHGANTTLLDPGTLVADILNITKIDAILEVASGSDANGIRARLCTPEALVGGGNSMTPGGVEGGFMPSINSDGTLNDDANAQKKEAVEDFCRRAVEHMRQGDYENSIECYKGALEVDPEYLPALNNLAIVYEKQPAWHPFAIEKWQRVLEISRQRNDNKHMDRAERHLADLSR